MVLKKMFIFYGILTIILNTKVYSNENIKSFKHLLKKFESMLLNSSGKIGERGLDTKNWTYTGR